MSHIRSLGTWAASLLIIVILILATSTLAQSKYKTLHRFSGNGRGKNGLRPMASLIFDNAGNLYSTTPSGGAYGHGTVFELTHNPDGSWTESVLYSFCSITNCSDGGRPEAGLIFDQAGNLYGTTYEGGSAYFSAGTVFKLSPKVDGGWTESVLHTFCSVTNCRDGEHPSASLIFDQTGNLYGTTQYGGSVADGVVFELTPHAGSWSERVLYNFCSLAVCSDGGGPYARLIFDQAGSLYGTGSVGGGNNCGVVFELTHTARGRWKEQVLHQFNYSDGCEPVAGVVFDQAGNLYGTTWVGGDSFSGVAFRLTQNQDGSWKEKVLHTFTGGKDGYGPIGGLTFDQTGTLYGTAEAGGKMDTCRGSGCGVVFKLSPNSKGNWKETVLHNFVELPGAYPLAALIFDASGKMYGTTEGDTASYGSVFEITP
jgi:uncharacterized repeat protein (TIGR03803 family)